MFYSDFPILSTRSVNDVDDVDYYDGPFDTIASNDASTPSASEVMDRLRNMELLLATVLPRCAIFKNLYKYSCICSFYSNSIISLMIANLIIFCRQQY
jgi:hypothetical protein